MTKLSVKVIEQAPDADAVWRAAGGDAVWLPYTQMKNTLTPLMAARTEGSRIYLEDGRVLIDGVASWWTACHGYNHPHIMEAMQEQLRRMPHVMFGGLNHEPALRLAKRLAALAPGDLSRVFFSDSGSVAVEVALKMAVQYWMNKGAQGRTKFVSFRHAYHGETAGCMGLCAPDEEMDEELQQYLAAPFHDYVPRQFNVDLPDDNNALDELLQRESDRIAGVVIEPLVQGVGGMKFHDASTLRKVAEICRKHDALLIADEIFTGFGRTGSMFACEQAGVVPDILCLGKALNGGAITMAATLAREHVFEAFWSDDPGKSLMHGTTFMANPLACAAANASLDLFEREPRLEQVKKIETLLRAGLEPCRALPGVVDVRVKGAIGVVELDKIRDLGALKQKFIEVGVWVRPFGNIVYLTPAFTIKPEELTRLTNAICNALKRHSRS
jgi:adenosylmethionine-8-amino-7-oxononanoate aminotransferase